MINFLMFGGIFLIFLGFPASIVVSIVFKAKKKKALIPVVCIPISLVFGLVFITVGASLYGQTDEYKESVAKKEKQVENIEDEQETVSEPIITQQISEEEEIQEPTYDFKYKDMTVRYLNHEVMVDSAGQTVLVVYYEFTNDSDKNKTFDYSFSDKCFQNGVEVERSYWHVNDESKNSGKEIKSGTTITVASSFVLGDSMDDVELEITPWVGDKILFEITLELE